MLINIDKIVNSAGLICDLIGAWFVAWEVVKQFRGSKFFHPPLPRQLGGNTVSESQKYREYEKKKYYKMKIGLFFLSAGFILQILSNWIISIINFINGYL